MSSNNSDITYANVTTNVNKRKRITTPSPVKVEKPEFDYTTSQTSMSSVDPASSRFSHRRRSQSLIAKSKKLAPACEVDDVVSDAACQTDDELIDFYIKLARQEASDKAIILKKLETESKITELLTDSITVSLQICESGLEQIQSNNRRIVREKILLPQVENQLSRDVNKILLDSERNKGNADSLQSVLRKVLKNTALTMEKFIKLKDLDMDAPVIPLYSSLKPDNDKNQSLNSTSLSASVRRSTKTPVRTNNKFLTARSVKFDSPISNFLSKETTELDDVNSTSNIEIEIPNTPDIPVLTQVDCSFPNKVLVPNFSDRNKSSTKDLNFDAFNISQESNDNGWFKIEITDSDKELLNYSDSSLNSDVDKQLCEEWSKFIKTEYVSDDDEQVKTQTVKIVKTELRSSKNIN